MATTNLGKTPDDVSFDEAFDKSKSVLEMFNHDAVYFVFKGVPVRVDWSVAASEAFEVYSSFSEPVKDRPDVDADGHLAADAPLTCAYCATKDSVEPILEYTGYGYSEHRDHVGFECDSCMARWNTDGTPNQGPHASSVFYRASVHRKSEKS